MCGFIESLSQGNLATFKSRCRIERMYLRRLQAKHGANYQCVRLVVFLISSTHPPMSVSNQRRRAAPSMCNCRRYVYMAPKVVTSSIFLSFSDCLACLYSVTLSVNQLDTATLASLPVFVILLDEPTLGSKEQM